MKKISRFLLILAALITAGSIHAQVVVFHENFSVADSVVSSGTPGWALSSRLSVSPSKSDSSRVSTGATSVLTTISFSTVGYSFVTLNFSHICKVEVGDSGLVEVSNDNGVTWNRLKAANYLGSSNFSTQGNRFNVTSYPTDWVITNSAAVPQNTWWKNEVFDISSFAANNAQIKVRFLLKDGNNNGHLGNYGWLIDDIIVNASPSELVPPVITLTTPIVQDTIFNTGPFIIKANITDASGIDTAYIAYNVNYGPTQYVGMTLISGNTYSGTIPSVTYNKHVDYYVHAIDNSPAANSANSVTKWFYTKMGPSVVQIGNGTLSEFYLPCYGYYDYGWGEQLYLQSEINTGGTIDSISFYVFNSIPSATPYVMLNQRMYMKHVPFSVFPDATMPDTTTMTRVYAGNVSWSGPGWFKIACNPGSFVYDGSSNLLIYWVNYDGSYTSGQPTFRYTATADNKGVYNYTDLSFPTTSGTFTTSRPDIRIAFQPANLNEDAGVKQITSPAGTVLTATPINVDLNIKNFGIDTLESVTINWSIDGTLQTPYSWTGSMLQGVVSPTITVGTPTFVAGTHKIKAWTTLPNDSIDYNHYNDTASVTFYACDNILNGTYTVGGGTADYATINDAINAMLFCGINGPVVFNINTGSYHESFTIPSISGVSATNTITFQSATGNANDVIIHDSSTSLTDNYILKLNGAKFIQWINVTFQNKGAGYGRVADLSGSNKNIVFEGNKFIGASTTSTSDYLSIIYNYTASVDSAITFRNNSFINGSYGFYYYGGTGASQDQAMTIDNNNFTNQYCNGMYLYYPKNTRIRGNILTTTSVYTSFNGFNIQYASDSLSVQKNKLACPVGYGIYMYYCTGTTALRQQVSNNFVSVAGIGTNSVYGLTNYYSNYIDFIYNSVNITSTYTSGYGFYIPGGSNARLYNNNVVNSGGGYAIYCSSSSYLGNSNYNNFYTSGTTLGYCGLTCSNLAAWKTASLKDTNSVSTNPLFVSATDLHVMNGVLNGIAKPISFITTDIDNEARNATTPDIGADEYTPSPWDASVCSITNPVTGCGLDVQHVTVKIVNYGSNTITGLDASYIPDNGLPTVTETITATILPMDTLTYTFSASINFGTTTDSTVNIVAWPTLTGDAFHINDTARVTVESYKIAADPVVVSPITIPYGTSTTITATSSDTMFWYNSLTALNFLEQGPSYTTPVLYTNPTTFYVDARGSAAGLFDVGTGTLSSSSYPTPYGQVYNSARDQYLILASELTDAGISAGPINSIAFNVTSNSGMDPLTDFTIKIGPTTQTSLSAFTNTGLTQVYTNTSYAVAMNWNTHTFTTPFIWDGTSNLLVDVCFNNYPNGYTSNAGVTKTTTAFNSALSYYSDTQGVCGTTLSPSSYTDRPNMRFEAMGGGCPSNRVPLVINLSGIPANDAGATSIITPNTGIFLTNSEVVSIKIHNYGTASISNFPVSYKIGTAVPVTETVTSTINSGDSLTYTFTTHADLSSSGTTYSFKAYTSLSGDIYHLNDTAYKTVTNMLPIYCTSGATSPASYEDIGNVTISNLNNGSATPVTSNTTAINGYTDFTTLPPVQLQAGVTYPASVSIISASSFYSTYVKIYIDYNRDGDFDLPGEEVFGAQATSTLTTVTGNVSVPLTATSGLTRMRVVAVETTSASSVLPCGTYLWGETEDYNVMIAPLIPNDAGVTTFTQPTGTLVTSGASVPVAVTIKNFGTQPLTACNIVYTVNGGTPVSQPWTGNLTTGATATATLTSFTAVDGNNLIKAYTVLAGDSSNTNDTSTYAVYAFPLFDVTWTDNFDGNDYWYAPNTVWQRGTPNSSIINSAYSAPNAWKTILAGNYPNSADAFLYSPKFDFQNVYNATLSFYQWYNIQTNYDAGRVEYSTDNGTTWTALGVVGDPLGTNWYNTNYAGFTGWSGNNGTWTQSRYVLSAFNNYSTPVQFRFRFKSDATTNQNGWAVDNFAITVAPIAKDAGVTEIILPGTGPIVTGTSTSVKVVVRNFGLDTLHSMTIAYKATGLAATTQTWTGTLVPADTMLFYFTQPYVSPDNDYRFCSYTILTGDTYHFNDSTCQNITYAPCANDAGILTIVQPAVQSYINYPNAVIVTLKNYGTNTITSMDVTYRVQTNAPVTETWTGSLTAGSTVDYTFATLFTPPINMYTFCAYTSLSTDAYRFNDTICSQSQGIIGVEEMNGNGLALYQNIPNPVNYGSTVIPYTLPENGEAIFEIRNVIGEIMYTEKVTQNAGKHSLEVNLSDWSSGLYFYSLTFGGDKLVKKLTIQK